MDETEVTINGETYRIGKLTAFQQFHVSRKIAPLIPPLVPAFMSLSEVDMAADKLIGTLAPLAGELAEMPDDKAEYVMGTTLSAVKRRQGESWAPIWSEQAKTLMFQDIDLGVAMQLVYRVIVDSLGPFIQGLLFASEGAPNQASTG